ncbi:MAG: hypothetical protein H3C54_14745 [Taibaiella sp.]|nr:hypothetical protein [Taibaiella sp.]
MKRALNLGLFSLLLAVGCTKTETKTDSCAMGTIKFINNSVYPYSLYLNDKLVKTQEKQSTYDHSGFTGHYAIKIVQDTGYVATPYTKEYSVDLGGCETETIVITKQPGEPEK